MRDFRDAKAMAQTLREALKTRSVSLTHSESLELIARTFGFPDWNFLAAKIQASRQVAGRPSPITIPPLTSAGSIVPIIPMRDLVLFPQMVVPIFVGRDKTRRAIERALATNRRILVVTQRRSADDDPALDALYAVGVTAGVVNCVALPDGTLKLVVSGLERTKVVSPVEEEFLAAEAAPIEESRGETAEAVVLSRVVLDTYRVYAKVDYSALPQELQARLRLPSIEDPGALADSIAPLLSIGIDRRQQLLETTDVITRLETILELMKAGQQAA
jgi:ATP-dependent Lon protease